MKLDDIININTTNIFFYYKYLFLKGLKMVT